MQLSHSGRIAALFATAALLLGSHTAFGQVRTAGAISGTVTDSTGAAVPAAKVILTDEGTKIKKEGSTNAEGSFTFPDLSFGSYEVSVVMAGFQNSVVPHVTVEASQTTDIPIKLQVGQQSQTVTVEGSTTPILGRGPTSSA